MSKPEMTNPLALKWWHAAMTSCVAAATLMCLVNRFFAAATDPPSLVHLVTVPPTDWGFVWYPVLAAPVLGCAYFRRSIRLVLGVQGMLFVAGFVHALWIVGTVPHKIDWRLVLIALTAHAVAWTSYLCAAMAVAIGLRRKANPSPSIAAKQDV